MELKDLELKICRGGSLTKTEAEFLLTRPLDTLCETANRVRQKCCGSGFELCTIINGKSGRCGENCKFCAQSACYSTGVEEYGIVDTQKVVECALANRAQGVHFFAIVTSGKRLADRELEKVCEAYRAVGRACDIRLCASHGLLTLEQYKKLKASGVVRCHNNLETSRSFFPKVCTTHTYDEKIEAIKNAKKAGLQVCSGGIIGLGESMQDRIDMALQLRELDVTSVPINVLSPIKGTPLGERPVLAYDEVLRTFAVFRMLLPKVNIRLAGGRALLPDGGMRVMQSGANAAISGDLLTTYGIKTQEDIKMIESMGYSMQSL